LIIRLE